MKKKLLCLPFILCLLLTGNSFAQNLNGQIFTISSAANNKCLDVYEGGTKNGTLVKLWTCHYGPGQQWKFIDAGNGKYYIRSVSGKSLDADGGTLGKNGTKIQLWAVTNDVNQQWWVTKASNGNYLVRCAADNKSLDADAGTLNIDGTKVQLWQTHNGINQQWILKSVAAPLAVLYEHINYGGNSLNINSDVSFLGNDWNDKVSSIKVANGYRLTVYWDAYYKGASLVITGNRDIASSNTDWNDKISSVKIEKITATVNYTAPEGYTLCAYENNSKSFNQPVDVAYGANGAFKYIHNMSGKITFNNTTFGDPAPGIKKAGYYKTIAPAVNGFNVKKVVYTTNDQKIYGSFYKTFGKNWIEKNNQGTNNFVETRRDEWSVYIKDISRNVDVQLDLYKKQVIIPRYNSTYIITSMSDR